MTIDQKISGPAYRSDPENKKKRVCIKGESSSKISYWQYVPSGITLLRHASQRCSVAKMPAL